MKKFEHNKENVLVCFCDASAKAYATAVYLLHSSIAPLTKLSFPRLELMAV
jgi:Na+/H+ antiporter NhaB